MDVATLLIRARSALGKNTKYHSPGIMPSFSGNSWPFNAANDCSGFIAWCLRFPSENRRVDHPLYKKINGGWLETTAIYADGESDSGYFTRLQTARPGAMLVYPDYTGSDGKNHDGHVGIVLEANGSGIEGVSKIIHCSMSNAAAGDAIKITIPGPWLRHHNSIIVWFDGLLM